MSIRERVHQLGISENEWDRGTNGTLEQCSGYYICKMPKCIALDVTLGPARGSNRCHKFHTALMEHLDCSPLQKEGKEGESQTNSPVSPSANKTKDAQFVCRNPSARIKIATVPGDLYETRCESQILNHLMIALSADDNNSFLRELTKSPSLNRLQISLVP